MDSKLSKKINGLEMSFWRRCSGLALEDHVRNDIIRQIMETEVTLTDTVEAKQLKWCGHMERMEEDRLRKKIYKWTRKEKERKAEKYLEEEGKTSNGWKKCTGRRLPG
ncbi:hypothetical protein Cfor_02812 [Coptotermes formosanus]|uniref:Uncharacterized protein n=1 Tax=Coptotermes formosanus TaxID=36987 RepID=A0A6L2Q4B0_COPFO|nr:hypothetical protein Cfor_02812 [Coptotermes formosanus]